MTYDTNKKQFGREPFEVLEILCDKCSKTHGSLNTKGLLAVAGYNDNRLKYSEDPTNDIWIKTSTSIAPIIDTPPDGSGSIYQLQSTGPPAPNISQTTASFSANIHEAKIRIKNIDTVQSKISIVAPTPGTIASIIINWTGAVPTIVATTGSAVANALGDDWYEIVVTTIAQTSAGTNILRIFPTTLTSSTESIEFAGAALYDNQSGIEYQYTEALDGSYTNIRMTTTPFTYDSGYTVLYLDSLNHYVGTSRNGLGYIRVSGDASGEGLSENVYYDDAADFCRAQHLDDVQQLRAVAYNDNRIKYSEDPTNVVWVKTNVTATLLGDTPPDGSGAVYELEYAGGVPQILQVSPSFSQNIHEARLRIKNRDAAASQIVIIDPSATFIAQIGISWAGTVPTIVATTGSAVANALGDDWYEIVVTTIAQTTVGTNSFLIFPAFNVGKASYFAGASLIENNSDIKYQYTEALDGSYTNIRFLTASLTVDNGYTATFYDSQNKYLGTSRSGEYYARVVGDATGEGTGKQVLVSSIVPSTPSLDPSTACYNTRATCQATDDYDASETFPYRFCSPRGDVIPLMVDAISPKLLSTSTSPTQIQPNEGLSVRGTLNANLTDHAHNDTGGVDPYVQYRTHDPAQGSLWSKFLARNKYYSGRKVKLYTGYVENDSVTFPTDFQVREYVIDRITGPNSSGQIGVIANDILSLAANSRAEAPLASQGVLAADITDSDTSATLSPAGIGDSEYPASGTIRIGDELCTFTRVADVLTLLRGTDGSTAAAHQAEDGVQLCLRYTRETLDNVIYELLVTYSAIDPSYIPFADWQEEADTWLAGHVATTIITEPTGVTKLLNEICSLYMIDLWWDDVEAEIKFQTLKPNNTVETITDDEILADSFTITDKPRERASIIQIWSKPRDWTRGLNELSNYKDNNVYAEAEASSSDEHGQVRFKNYVSRWFSSNGDQVRLGSRMLSWLRDNPQEVTFALDIKNEFQVGEVLKISTRYIQDATGASVPLQVRIIEKSVAIAGHSHKYIAVDDAFADKYGMITEDTAPDYNDATDAERAAGAWICEDAEPQLNGDGPYAIV